MYYSSHFMCHIKRFILQCISYAPPSVELSSTRIFFQPGYSGQQILGENFSKYRNSLSSYLLLVILSVGGHKLFCAAAVGLTQLPSSSRANSPASLCGRRSGKREWLREVSFHYWPKGKCKGTDIVGRPAWSGAIFGLANSTMRTSAVVGAW